MNYYKLVIKCVADILKDFGVTQAVVDELADGELYTFIIDYDLWEQFGHSQSYENFLDYIQECVYNTVDMPLDDIIDNLEEIEDDFTYEEFIDKVESQGIGITFDATNYEELFEDARKNSYVRGSLAILFTEDLVYEEGTFFIDPFITDDQFLSYVYDELD